MLKIWDFASMLGLTYMSGTWELGPHVNQPSFYHFQLWVYEVQAHSHSFTFLATIPSMCSLQREETELLNRKQHMAQFNIKFATYYVDLVCYILRVHKQCASTILPQHFQCELFVFSVAPNIYHNQCSQGVHKKIYEKSTFKFVLQPPQFVKQLQRFSNILQGVISNLFLTASPIHPLSPITRAHLNMFECLQHKAGWIWVKRGSGPRECIIGFG